MLTKMGAMDNNGNSLNAVKYNRYTNYKKKTYLKSVLNFVMAVTETFRKLLMKYYESFRRRLFKMFSKDLYNPYVNILHNF